MIQACSGEPYVFGTARGNRFQRFGKQKPAIDKLCGVTGWRLHDLRRTIVSGIARLGIPPHIADKILNHQAGTISGVAAVYQRHDFLAEREEALDRWGVRVENILQNFVHQKTSNLQSRLQTKSVCRYWEQLMKITATAILNLQTTSR